MTDQAMKAMKADALPGPELRPNRVHHPLADVAVIRDGVEACNIGLRPDQTMLSFLRVVVLLFCAATAKKS